MATSNNLVNFMGWLFFVGVVVEALPPLTIVTLRVFLAAIALLAVVYFTGSKMPSSPTILVAFIGMGVLNNVIPFTLIVWGLPFHILWRESTVVLSS